MTGRVGSLFSGYGGLDLAVEAAFGAAVVWHADNDPAAQAVLARRWPCGVNLGDVTTIDWPRLAATAPVDILTGGFPCQDVSTAGRRAGLTPHTRSGLWAHMRRAVSVLRPRLVVIENVRGLLSATAYRDVEPEPDVLGNAGTEPVLRAAGAVLGDLAQLGYDASWCGLRAADVGAAHGRYRVFIVATDTRSGEIGEQPVAKPGRGGAAVAGLHHPSTADTEGNGWHQGRTEPARLVGGPDASVGGAAAADPDRLGRSRAGTHGGGGPGSADRHCPAADTDSSRRREVQPQDGPRQSNPDWGDYTPAIARWERILGRPAPPPTQPGRRGNPVLAPRFVEWLMGLPDGWVTDIPDLTRNAQLRLLGNGVVPQQAHAALTALDITHHTDNGSAA